MSRPPYPEHVRTRAKVLRASGLTLEQVADALGRELGLGRPHPVTIGAWCGRVPSRRRSPRSWPEEVRDLARKMYADLSIAEVERALREEPLVRETKSFAAKRRGPSRSLIAQWVREVGLSRSRVEAGRRRADYADRRITKT